MLPLNPFLRAFFRSALPSQCSPVQHHILLCPTTDLLLTARDRETHVLFSDLSSSEDFLASHVLRVPGGVAPSGPGKDTSFRDSRSKAKQYATLNGRSVIVKDAFVYSNKGFKSLNQVQLLHDVIYYPNHPDAQPWLVYYISKPLIGAPELMRIVPAMLDAGPPPVPLPNSPNEGASKRKKKEIRDFGELLNHFPMIARQLQPGLERLFKELGREFEKPLPPPPAKSPRTRSRRASMDSLSSSVQESLNSAGRYLTALEVGEEEDLMRRALETAVTAAIDLFQMVDKQQLSLLGATTDLTGPVVERMIERYVAEQVNDHIIFPRLCAIRRNDDAELEARVRQMAEVDVSQVGIPVGRTLAERKELSQRLSKGVELLKKIGTASSPQEMMEILLATEKLITKAELTTVRDAPMANGAGLSEKRNAMLTMNADTLVSLLLIVVIRAPVRHLHARLAYMRHFIFMDDVESGEMGYALSTFEVVLSYLLHDSAGLRTSSRRNRLLWQATKAGDVAEMRSMLEPEERNGLLDVHETNGLLDAHQSRPEYDRVSANYSMDGATLNGESSRPNGYIPALAYESAHNGSLAHVFPFERAPSPPRPKIKKRVSVQTRSTSSSSGWSVASISDTVVSRSSARDADHSTEKLARTRGLAGESVLMMAVEAAQAGSLAYLLSLEVYYPLHVVLEDENDEGTTLLSAAVQSGHTGLPDLLFDFIVARADEGAVKEYLARVDCSGRCVAHYLFHYPRLIARIGRLLPWRLKDKNGQTPLFALCRSYDHADYRSMVDAALSSAAAIQADGQMLHLDEHVDGKGNTLLHVVADARLAGKLLRQCDSDVNAQNDKHFTPLMVASKYGRIDMVRALFADPRVDLHAKDLRGLTATELAKDDDVRNRIDDLVLLSAPAPPPGVPATMVVRSYFVEDGQVRFIVKTATPGTNGSITVTTSRRTLSDFEHLASCLALEHPASWLPRDALPSQSAFLLPSRPSRSLARDASLRLNAFLTSLLRHPTFATHELVWEFVLVPDIHPAALSHRSALKAAALAERVRDETPPLEDARPVEVFIRHARDSVAPVLAATRGVLCAARQVAAAQADLADALGMAGHVADTLVFVPVEYRRAVGAVARVQASGEGGPWVQFAYAVQGMQFGVSGVLGSGRRGLRL
ncbi:hypothetical protein EJ06DRAFT_548322 [Trichodelitschia bisporula]|uniref:VPS9 domain-containing protein n=1 Tax=Trichodelitschia bisporula TaxID=703511 RepID=A0A6G1HZA9_9PEZI|nr:hypothetical protein EJ06DRAFT_548322 [Trichodelitschia bisporula]